jgi:hypothetical protein
VTVTDTNGGSPPPVVFRDPSGVELFRRTAPTESSAWVYHTVSFDDSAAGGRIASVDITTAGSAAARRVEFLPGP